MSTLKLVGLFAAWVLAAVAIAVVAAIVLTEFLDLIGVVESGQPSYSWAINGIALVVFVALVAVPVVFRGRFIDD
jgi:heme exporter protein D